MAAPSSVRSNAGTKGVARSEREAQILDVACRTFGERGYAATSVADIAAAAGISKPLIYNYFGSKDGLHAACLRQAADVLWGSFARSAARGAVAVPRAVATLDDMFRTLAPRPWLWRAVFDQTAPTDGESGAILADFHTRVFALGKDGVAELLGLTGNDDAGDMSALHAVWESAFRALVTWFLDHPEVTPQAMTQRCVRLFAAVFGDSVSGDSVFGDAGAATPGSAR